MVERRRELIRWFFVMAKAQARVHQGCAVVSEESESGFASLHRNKFGSALAFPLGRHLRSRDMAR
jgi:hypothetical protein